MFVRLIGSTAMVSLLVGCGGAPIEIQDMQSAVDARLAEGSVSATVTSFQAPISVADGLALGLRTAVLANDSYIAASALEREAKGEIGVAASLRRPQLTGGANLGAIRETGSGGETTRGLAGGMNLGQLVYDGGASAAAMNRATAMALAAQAGRVVQGNEIALNAARAWIDLWQYSERLRQMQTRTSQMDTLVEQIERMASNGMLDKASVESARRQIVDIKLEESRLQAGRSEALVLFQRFFHAQPLSIARPAELVNVAQARSLAAGWQAAPALQRQAAEVLAAQASVREAEAAFRPRARFQAGARSPLESGESADLTVGLSLEYSFNDGGRRRNQLEAAAARLEATDAQLTDAQRGLEAELNAGLTRLASIERAVPLLADKLRLSRSEAETSRSQLMTGQSSLRQLVEAEIEIFRAQDQQIALQAERQILLLTIAARTGALGPLIGLQD